MGFKITHPLLPRRRLAWPLWHTSTRRQHVPPDRMSGTTDTTKWPRCLLFHCVLVEFTLSRGGLLTFWLDPAFINLVPHSRGGDVTPADGESPPSSPSVWNCSQSRFSFTCWECFLISISVWMSLHLWVPRPSRSRCILFIILLNWFHSVQANTRSADW